MPTPVNNLKTILCNGQKACGAWLHLGSAASAEIIADAGFDFVVIDMEHGPGDFMTLGDQLRAMRGTQTTALVRVPWNDPVFIKRVLDIGAHGVHVPYVNTAGETRQAVAAAKYPPQGFRGAALSPRAAGYGMKPASELPEVNEQIFVMVAVETVEAVDNVSEIAATPGVDAILLGPMDLAATTGYIGTPNAPEVQAVIKRFEKNCQAAKMPMCTVAGNWPQAEGLFETGYSMLLAMSDSIALARHSNELTKEFAARYRK